MGTVRPYQPVTPANNQYLAKRWDHEIFNTHRKKVIAAKAVIDNDPPRVHMHLHIKLKKLQFEAERLATIERDNRILLEKMAHIMRSGGVVDNKKEDYHLKSLNKIKRQRELLRITHENLAILKRLMTKDPHYNHKKWNLQWQVNQQYLMNISKYPHPWRQEQSPYISQTERQTMANKLINKKVHSPNKSKSTAPNPGSRSAGRTQDLAKTSVRHAANARSVSAQLPTKVITPTIEVSKEPTIEVSIAPPTEASLAPTIEVSKTPAVEVGTDTEESGIPFINVSID